MSTIAPAYEELPMPNTFAQVLQDWQLDVGQPCWLVIDAARYEEGAVLNGVYALCDQPEWDWLFSETPLAPHGDAGPLVVRSTLGSRLCRHAASHWADGGTVILVTGAGLDSAVAGIRQSLEVSLETHGPCILRPYDGRFLEVLAACLPDLLNALVAEDCALLWSVDSHAGSYWSGGRGVTSGVPGIPRRQGHKFERMLTWVSGWPLCASIAGNAGLQGARSESRLAHALWSAGHACPGDGHQLASLWRDHKP